MKTSELNNFTDVKKYDGLEDVIWLDAKDEPFMIYGLSRIEKGVPFLRMPDEIAKTVSRPVSSFNHHTSGGRVRFKTNSPYIAVISKGPVGGTMPNMTMAGQSGFDLYKSDNGKYEHVASYISVEDGETGYRGKLFADGKMHTYTLYMPLYDGVTDLYIGLAENSIVEEPEPYKLEKPIVYYGSSITQGGCASRPGNAYQAMISRKYDCNYVCLGFAGNARGEKEMAEYIASLDASVFVCDYDHNAYDADFLKETHYAMYRIFRDKNPKTPVIFISKPDFHWDIKDNVDRRHNIMTTYMRAVQEGDNNVYFVDGAHIFDGEFADSCTVDGCHPNDLGFFRMATHIGDAIEIALKYSL